MNLFFEKLFVLFKKKDPYGSFWMNISSVSMFPLEKTSTPTHNQILT